MASGEKENHMEKALSFSMKVGTIKDIWATGKHLGRIASLFIRMAVTIEEGLEQG